MTTSSSHGVGELARETALSLGHLVGQHVKIARLELTAELHEMIRRAWLVAVLATLLATGYLLAIFGLAVVLGGGASWGLPLGLVGVVHVVGAGAGLILGPLRGRRSPRPPLHNSATALERTLDQAHVR